MENLKAEISTSANLAASVTSLQLESEFGSVWRIPRPSIHGSTSSSTNTSQHGVLTQYQRNINLAPKIQSDSKKWSSNQSTSSSSNLTEGSDSLLLSPYRLHKDPDTVSIASSTNFTIVNGMRPEKSSKKCCQTKYQLSILVVSMTFIIFLGILAAVLYIQIRARDLRQTQEN